MTLALYLAVSLAIIALTHRFVVALPRASAALLILFPLAFTGEALLTGKVFAPVDLAYLTEPFHAIAPAMGVTIHNPMLSDVFAQMMPWRRAVQGALAQRQWPLLDPFLLCGAQLAGSGQAAAYSPFTIVACLLPLAASMTFSAAIAFFMAGLGAYLFARELDCGQWPSLFGAVAWMYATPLAVFIEWPMGMAWALLPASLLAVRRVAASPSIRSATLLFVVFTLLILCGHPETTLHVVAITVVYAIVEMVRRRSLARPLAYTTGAGLAALALTAIYLLPLIEAAPQTIEYAFRHNIYAKDKRGSSAVEGVARVAADLLPHVIGQKWTVAGVKEVPFDGLAAGSIVLALAVYTAWRVRHRDKALLIALALFAIGVRANAGPLMNGLRALPLFDVTVNDRLLYAGSFALAMLAAIGLDSWQRRADDRALVATMLLVLVTVVGGAAIIDEAKLVSGPAVEWGAQPRAAEAGFLALSALVVVAGDRWRRVAFPALLALLLLQRYAEVGRIYPTLPARVAYPPLALLEPLQHSKDVFRIAGQGYALLPNTATIYGLEDVRGYEALTFRRLFETYRFWSVAQPVWFNRVDDLSRAFLSLINVRYAIQSEGKPTPEGWRLVAAQRGSELLENARVLPRAFVPEAVRFTSRPSQALEEVGAVSDFRRMAWIEGTAMAGHDEANAAGEVRVRRHKSELRIAADMHRGGWVVISEAAWKGWRVYIDGRRVRWFYADQAFLGVYVPAGHHSMRVVYRPEGFVIGAAISGVTLVALAALGAISWMPRASSASRTAGSHNACVSLSHA